MSESSTLGQTLVEVTITVRLYAASQAHAALEVDDRLVRVRDEHALRAIRMETKLVVQK